MFEYGKISGGRVPLEELQKWRRILSEDDPKGSAFTQLELDDFLFNQIVKSMIEYIKAGQDFETWFSKYKQTSEKTEQDLEMIKDSLANYFYSIQELQK